MALILQATNLCKSFRYQKRSKGFNWFKPEYVTVDAVQSINLSIEQGECIAFVGPNGAGKSTTIKMLSGILTPTSGELMVCGLNPILNRRALSYRIGCVFGQRSQLLPNLPLQDSLELFGRMYDMTEQQVKTRTEHMTEVFALDEFINQPVRQLSLGQRMRGEIAASLMHSPEIIFLDEPTIGLDVIAKQELRKTLLALNSEEKTTVFLTSHDTGDIEFLSQRLVVVDHGKIIIDTPTAELQKKYITKKYFKIDYAVDVPAEQITGLGFEMKNRTVEGFINTTTHGINEVLHQLLNIAPVADIHLFDESLEEIIIDIYRNSQSQ
jgi:ABC-2 type transport system ATP-binding protein